MIWLGECGDRLTERIWRLSGVLGMVIHSQARNGNQMAEQEWRSMVEREW